MSDEAQGFFVDLENDGKWFDIENGARIKLRAMTADVNKGIRKKTVKKKTVFKKVEGTPYHFDIEETNEDLQNELFWDWVIVDWENFFDKKGTSIECTKDNKLLLIAKSLKFDALLNDCLKELAEYEVEQAKDEEKN